MFVDRALEFAQRRDRRFRPRKPIQEDGIVTREELQFVFERDEIALGDLRVTRIGIFHVDGIILEGRVTESVIDSDYIARV